MCYFFSLIFHDDEFSLHFEPMQLRRIALLSAFHQMYYSEGSETLICNFIVSFPVREQAYQLPYAPMYNLPYSIAY